MQATAVGRNQGSAPAAIGQLYLVHIRAEMKDTGETIKSCYLMNGSDRDDMARKLHYVVDVSEYRVFSITKVERVRGNFHLVWQHISQPQDAPKAVIATADGSQPIYDRTNQPSGRGAFAVGIAGAINAMSADHALRKLGAYLMRRGTRQLTVSPLHGKSVVHVEEMGEGSNAVMPRAMDEFTRATFVSGGAIGGAR